MPRTITFALVFVLGTAAFAEEKAFVGIRFGSDARVAHVFPGAPAEQAGLAVGDVVRKFGDDEITSTEQLQGLIQAKKPGDKATLKVQRGGSTLTLTVTLATRPATAPTA